MQHALSVQYLPVITGVSANAPANNVARRRNGALCQMSCPMASVLFVVSVACHVLTGVVVLAWPPESRDRVGTIKIPDSATCLRATRHAAYTTVDVMIGTPPTQMSVLLRLDGVQSNNDTRRGLRLFAQSAVQSQTVTCSAAGWCKDIMIATDGKRRDHIAYTIEFDYRHASVEQSMYTTASRIAGVAGELFMREGYAYWLTPTHLCYSIDFVIPSMPMLPTTLSAEGNMLIQQSDMSFSSVLNSTPAASIEARECSGLQNLSIVDVVDEVVLFPEESFIEANWLSIFDAAMYNTEPNTVESRRFITEVGIACAAGIQAYHRELSLYILDCAPYQRCITYDNVPFRRVAKSSLFFTFLPDRPHSMWIAEDHTLDGLPNLADSTNAFVASLLKMLMVTVAAAVVFVRSKKKTASSSWLFKNCVRIAKGQEIAAKQGDRLQYAREDQWVGLVSLMSRFVVTLLRFRALREDQQLRVCVLELVGAVLSMLHWTNRWCLLATDKNEKPVSKLGGSTAIVDSTSAVMVAFSESPTLATSTNKFDPTARMLVSLLVSIIVLTRCAFSAACCGTLWPVFQKQGERRAYAMLLLLSAIHWCVQSAILAVTVCDLFVAPAAYSMSRFTVGRPFELYTLRACLFLGVVNAGLPRLTSTARHILSEHEHVD